MRPDQEAAVSVAPHGRSLDRASAARRTIDTLSAEPDVWEEFFDSVRIGLALADLTTRYIRVNMSYAALLGRSPEDLVGVPVTEVLHPDDRAASDAHVARLLRGGAQTTSAEERYVTRDGAELWVLHGVSLVLGPDGEAGWFAVSAQDITERRRVEQELRDLTAVLAERAVRDPLTGLANRTLVEERLRRTLARDARSGGTTGVLFLDLDGFKAVNDAHGHAVGDAVLRTVAQRLMSCVRPSDTVARIGGDEFVVLAEDTTRPGLEPLVDRLRAAVRRPVMVETLEVEVGVSVGVAVSTGGEADVAGLLAEADRAMYAAKKSDRGFDPPPPRVNR